MPQIFPWMLNRNAYPVHMLRCPERFDNFLSKAVGASLLEWTSYKDRADSFPLLIHLGKPAKTTATTRTSSGESAIHIAAKHGWVRSLDPGWGLGLPFWDTGFNTLDHWKSKKRVVALVLRFQLCRRWWSIPGCRSWQGASNSILLTQLLKQAIEIASLDTWGVRMAAHPYIVQLKKGGQT